MIYVITVIKLNDQSLGDCKICWIWAALGWKFWWTEKSLFSSHIFILAWFNLFFDGPRNLGFLAAVTGWKVRRLNPGKGGNFLANSEWPRGLSSLLYDGYRTLPGIKGAWAWCSLSTHFCRRGYEWFESIANPQPPCAFKNLSCGILYL